MAYDEKLTQRFRDAVDDAHALTEKRMMGGVCFMYHGNMLGGADRHKTTEIGRFMFRVGKDNQEKALQRKGAIPVEQGGRTMTGLVFVSESDCNKTQLKSWINLAMKFVGKLPAK
ncbi:MAG: TfoX/Sxy family protein [Granulosicoccaceae bacterium]